jgi:hypothetical protein
MANYMNRRSVLGGKSINIGLVIPRTGMTEGVIYV